MESLGEVIICCLCKINFVSVVTAAYPAASYLLGLPVTWKKPGVPPFLFWSLRVLGGLVHLMPHRTWEGRFISDQSPSVLAKHSPPPAHLWAWTFRVNIKLRKETHPLGQGEDWPRFLCVCALPASPQSSLLSREGHCDKWHSLHPRGRSMVLTSGSTVLTWSLEKQVTWPQLQSPMAGGDGRMGPGQQL